MEVGSSFNCRGFTDTFCTLDIVLTYLAVYRESYIMSDLVLLSPVLYIVGLATYTDAQLRERFMAVPTPQLHVSQLQQDLGKQHGQKLLQSHNIQHSKADMCW